MLRNIAILSILKAAVGLGCWTLSLGGMVKGVGERAAESTNGCT